jgi:hypothetical protein
VDVHRVVAAVPDRFTLAPVHIGDHTCGAYALSWRILFLHAYFV